MQFLPLSLIFPLPFFPSKARSVRQVIHFRQLTKHFTRAMTGQYQSKAPSGPIFDDRGKERSASRSSRANYRRDADPGAVRFVRLRKGKQFECNGRDRNRFAAWFRVLRHILPPDTSISLVQCSLQELKYYRSSIINLLKRNYYISNLTILSCLLLILRKIDLIYSILIILNLKYLFLRIISLILKINFTSTLIK